MRSHSSDKVSRDAGRLQAGGNWRKALARLGIGMTFPETSITLSDGASMTLPGDMGDGWKVIIFYRGSW
jgi:hypothetical protein